MKTSISHASQEFRRRMASQAQLVVGIVILKISLTVLVRMAAPAYRQNPGGAVLPTKSGGNAAAFGGFNSERANT